MTSTQLKLVWRGKGGSGRKCISSHYGKPQGESPLGTVGSTGLSEEIRILTPTLHSAFSLLVLQEVAKVATRKSGFHPNSLTSLAGKECPFLNSSMINGLQLGPNVQPRKKSPSMEMRWSYSFVLDQMFTFWT